MARYYLRHFRVVDCSRHCGLPVASACFLLALVTGAMQAYSMYFMYETWDWIMMGYMGAVTVVGLAAVLTGFRIFTMLYLLTQTLALIPVAVVIGYLSYMLSNWNYYYYYPIQCYYDNDYECWISKNFSEGMCWSGEIVSCISFPFSFLTLAGYRKLRLHQSGVDSAVQQGRHLAPADQMEAQHHHHVHPVIVQQPAVIGVQQPTVLTVPNAPPYIVQTTNPSIYPQLHTAAPYGTAAMQSNQPTTVYIQ